MLPVPIHRADLDRVCVPLAGFQVGQSVVDTPSPRLLMQERFRMNKLIAVALCAMLLLGSVNGTNSMHPRHRSHPLRTLLVLCRLPRTLAVVFASHPLVL